MRFFLLVTLIGGLFALGCQEQQTQAPAADRVAAAEPKHASNVPPMHPNNIVRIAMGSKAHTTLVAALEAAEYVTSVAASGPLTVFAPTNAAFDKLPPGTVEDLVKPENADNLREILKYHVTTSALQTKWLKDGQSLGMANGAKTKISVKDGKISINGANIVTSIPASNGIVHVIDAVLLPPEG